MPLTFARPGHTGVIQRILGKDEARRHLETLGFVVGVQVTVVAERNGSLILQIREGRVALDRTTASRILISEGAIKRRIMDMGITKGVTVFVRKVAPLGDPMEVTVRGYELSLRKADCAAIEVQ